MRKVRGDTFVAIFYILRSDENERGLRVSKSPGNPIGDTLALKIIHIASKAL